MGRQEQVLEEKAAFQRFRDLLEPSITQGWLKPVRHTDESLTPEKGAPDFLVRNSSDHVIGIELLSLTNQEKQAESARRWGAIYRAQQRFEACCHLALWISIVWSGYVGALPELAVAEELFTLLFAYRDRFRDDSMELTYADFLGLFPRTTESDSKPELSLKTLACYVSSVTVHHAPAGMKAFWRYHPTDYTPTIGGSELMKMKKQKEDKVEQYLHHCQEVWLLIYYGVVRMNKISPALDFHIELERPVGSKFDKLWLLEEELTYYEQYNLKARSHDRRQCNESAQHGRARDRRPLAVWNEREWSRQGGGPRRQALAKRPMSEAPVNLHYDPEEIEIWLM